MDAQPTVCFFGSLDADAVKKKYSTLTTHTYSTDENILSILKEKQPEYLITIGESWKQFPVLARSLPAYYRKRWLHYGSLDELSETTLYNAWMNSIFDFSVDTTNPLVSIFTTSYKSG